MATVGGGVSPLPREARPYQGLRAGVVTRMAAAVIDAFVVAAVLLMGYGIVAVLRFMVDPRSFSFPQGSWLLNLTAALVVTVVYLTVAWAIGGRTYGMLVMGLRVVAARGQRLGAMGALLRAFACAVFPIGLLWCAANSENRSLQDVLLRTSVIYDWRPRGAPGRSPGPQ